MLCIFLIAGKTLTTHISRDNGYLLPDKIYPCAPVTTQPVANEAEQDARCVVKLGWLWIDSASFR